MTYDPFAAAPQPVEDTAPEPAPQEAPTTSGDVWATPSAPQATPVDDSEQVRITFKAGAGYDAPWVTVDFPSIDVAHAKLNEADRQHRLVELFDITARAAGAFHQKFSGGASPRPQAAPQQQQTPPQQQAPGGEVKTCKHGQMQFKSGFSQKTGKTWQAYFCPTPKGTPDQCKAEFVGD